MTLLAVSGWFVTAAALAGAAGGAAFNYLLSAACIRLLAILRTGDCYAERMLGHDASLRALAHLRPALFRALASAPPAIALRLSAGEAAARMTQDADAVEARFVQRPAAAAAMAALATGTAILFLAGGP